MESKTKPALDLNQRVHSFPEKGARCPERESPCAKIREILRLHYEHQLGQRADRPGQPYFALRGRTAFCVSI
jgi:hypothetical protein